MYFIRNYWCTAFKERCKRLACLENSIGMKKWCQFLCCGLQWLLECRSSLLQYGNYHHYLNSKFQISRYESAIVCVSPEQEPSRFSSIPKVIYCARIEDIRLQSAQQHHLSTNRTTCVGNKNRETVAMFHVPCKGNSK